MWRESESAILQSRTERSSAGLQLGKSRDTATPQSGVLNAKDCSHPACCLPRAAPWAGTKTKSISGFKLGFGRAASLWPAEQFSDAGMRELDRHRLGKLLGMLASAHDSELAAAGRRVMSNIIDKIPDTIGSAS